MGPTHPWWSFGGAKVARRRLIGKESDIKQALPFLVKGVKGIFGIFLKEAKLAPTSNANLEVSLRAILEAQSLGEKGETFRNASRPHQLHIHPHFHLNSENTPFPFTNIPLGLTFKISF